MREIWRDDMDPNSFSQNLEFESWQIQELLQTLQNFKHIMCRLVHNPQNYLKPWEKMQHSHDLKIEIVSKPVSTCYFFPEQNPPIYALCIIFFQRWDSLHKLASFCTITFYKGVQRFFERNIYIYNRSIFRQICG